MKKILCLKKFKDFHCKCDLCRNTCCEYWHITLSQKEYYALMSLSCSIELKDKLDHAFYVLPDATEDRFAEVNLNYFGQCPLLDEKGYCGLQKECGEKVLPKICINYPRSNRYIRGQEIALSTSCEKTVELLFNGEKEQFTTIDFEDSYFNLPLEDIKNLSIKRIRRHCISLIQKERFSFEKRILSIRDYLEDLNESKFDLPLEIWNDKTICYLKQIIKELFTKSIYLSTYEQDAIEDTDTYQTILKKRRDLEKQFPFLQRDIENILVNHIFYMNFPFTLEQNLETNYIGFTTVYLLLVYMLICNGKLIHNQDGLVDMVAFLFRIIEHTNFYYNCHVIYKIVYK